MARGWGFEDLAVSLLWQGLEKGEDEE